MSMRFGVEKMAHSESGRRLRVTLKKSVIGRLASHRACVRGLGLRRMHQCRVVEDTPCMRGMINKVAYLLDVEEIQSCN